jgi:uncharacterized protein YjiK
MRPAPLACLALLLAAALGACDRPAPAAASAVDPEDVDVVPYRLDAPDDRFALPGDLREISGLTVLPNGRLGAVQDEEGVVFDLDPATGRVVDQLEFGESGDYEGIAVGPDALWVLRSDGDLYRVARADDGSVSTDKTETALAARNDTEGLTYDPASGWLLVAAKEDPDAEGAGRLDGVRAVYAFDPVTRALRPDPAFLLDRQIVDDGTVPFKPSGLAVHPLTGRVYVLSSVRTALAVVDPDGTLLAVRPLDAALFPQPEGIAFFPDGTLFIANEGPAGPGTLLRFAPADA